jgi:DNA-binding transcriptional ArsR family regulator
MAEPAPNHTHVPNAILDRLIVADITDGQRRIVLCLLRQGCYAKSVALSARKIGRLTTMQPTRVSRILRKLELLGIVAGKEQLRRIRPPIHWGSRPVSPRHTVSPDDTVCAVDTEEIRIDLEVLRMMRTELESAEPGHRYLITDEYGKVQGALRQPSTYPTWMDELHVARNRHTADRLTRLVTTVLAGGGIRGKDIHLWGRVRGWATRNRERMYGRWGLTPPEKIDVLASVSDITSPT